MTCTSSGALPSTTAEFARAQCATIRLKLLKIGAVLGITVRKVWVSLAGGYPYAELVPADPCQVDCATAEGLKKQDSHITLVSVPFSPGRGVPKLAFRDRKQSLRPRLPRSVTRPCLANISLASSLAGFHFACALW
jgi:hypothetical protein